MVGVITIELAFIAPGFQVKLPTADGATADKVVVLPGHVMAGFAVRVMLGPGSTMISCVAEPVQEPEAPIAVYVVVTVGLKVAILEATLPGNQVILAPRPMRVTAVPAHTELVAAEAGLKTTIEILGAGLALIVVVTVAIQPAKEVATVV